MLLKRTHSLFFERINNLSGPKSFYKIKTNYLINLPNMTYLDQQLFNLSNSIQNILIISNTSIGR